MTLQEWAEALQWPWDPQNLTDQQFALAAAGFAIVLSLWLLISLVRIHRLKRQLTIERKKRTMPVLRLGIDPQIAGLYLINDSSAAAKNIHIKEFDLTLVYEHKKVLHLKFSPIDMLEPGKQVKLDFQIFDGTYLMTSIDPHGIAPHFKGATFEMRLDFHNLENIPFREIIARDQGDVYIKELYAVEGPEKERQQKVVSGKW